MESHLASKDSSISDAFVHKLPNTVDWAVQRRMVRFYNSGGSFFSSTGVKVFRHDLTSSGTEMLDPTSVVLQFKLKNDSYDGSVDKNIHLVNGMFAAIKRIVVRAGGVQISDEDYVNRAYHMLLQMAPKDARSNLSIASGKRGDVVGEEAVFSFPVLAPIFEQQKMLPLSFMSLSVSFELVDQATDIMLKNSELPAGVSGQSTAWHIEEPILMASLVGLDSSLSNEFSNHLLKGKSLSIAMVQRHHIPHTITTGQGGYQLAMTRSLTRIKAILQTFSHMTNDKYAYDLKYPSLSSSQVMEWQAFIASRRYPEAAINSVPEFWMKLLESMQIHSNVYSNSAIELSDYTGDSFIAAVNLQKVLYPEEAAGNFSGETTRNGDLLNFHAKNVSTSVDTAWTMLIYDSIITISEEGVQEFS